MSNEFFKSEQDIEIEKLKKEKGQLEKQLDKIKKDAVDALTKKENEISKLKNKLSERTAPSDVKRLKDSKNKYKEKSKEQTATIREKNKEISKKEKEISRLKRQHEAEMREIKNNFIPLGEFQQDEDIVNPFPGVNNPIFDNLMNLINNYPNKHFIKTEINSWIDNEAENVTKHISYYQKQLQVINSLEHKKKKYLDEEELISNLTPDEKEAYAKEYLTEDYIKNKITVLKNNRQRILTWKELSSNINGEILPELPNTKNKLYYQIKDEFYNVYDLVLYSKSPYEFKAIISNNKDDKSVYVGKLTRELEKQMSLRRDDDSKQIFYHDGDGRLIDLNPQGDINLQRIITHNSYFKYNDKFLDTNFISSKTIYNEIPSKCNRKINTNPNIVTFKNGFYNPKKAEFIQLNPQAPLLGYKQCAVNLYLNEDIDGGALEDIITTCFSKEDQRILLAYIGCCLYDPGYTKRQETLFLLGKGGIGKTAVMKAILKIFSRIAVIGANKITNDNKFCYADFSNHDIIIVEEIQSAKGDFTEKLKEISSGNALEIEKKGIDPFTLPDVKIPRLFIDGNKLPITVKDNMEESGTLRRILPITAAKSFKDLGYTVSELEEQHCLEWVAQQATKAYQDLGLINHDNAIDIIGEEEQKRRIELVTCPEKVFLDEHFDFEYDVKDVDDYRTKLEVEKVQSFLKTKIDGNMLSITSAGDMYSLSNTIRETFYPQKYGIIQESGQFYFPGLSAKSDEAMEFFQ